MNLLAFGATGSVGRQVVAQALEQGHAVTAFVRDPAKLDIADPQLQVFEGDVLDPSAVEAAMHGHDAVLCALGAGRKGVVRSEGTRNIISAMEKSGVTRLICQSTLGVGDRRYCQMLWMVRERIRRIQAAFFISPSTNGTPWMTWVMSL